MSEGGRERYDGYQTGERNYDGLIHYLTHEIRTPLTVVRLYTDMMASGTLGTFTLEEQENLLSIQTDLSRIERVVGAFVECTRSIINIEGLERAPADLADLCQESIHILTHKARDKEVDLTFHRTGDTAGVFNRGLIAWVTNDMILKAIDDSETGGVITVRTTGSDDGILFEVEARGSGLQIEDRARIAERSSGGASATGHEPDERNGLPLSREIIKAHGGRSGVRIKAGEGSRFWFSLPPANASAGDPIAD